MNFPYYIAKRYLFSKKGTNAINVISAVSMGGIAVATMALIVVLSVFNGFHDLVASFFTTFDPQLQIVPTMGKDAPTDDPILTQIKQLPEIDVATECVEDQALAIYQDKQAMVRIKGVEDNFDQLTHITEILYGDGNTNYMRATYNMVSWAFAWRRPWEREHISRDSFGYTLRCEKGS